jgi:predicted alpha/beta-fold hydrolase
MALGESDDRQRTPPPAQDSLETQSSGIFWGLFDAMLSPATPMNEDQNAQSPGVRRQGSIRRKGMPSGCKSLVPEGYVLPHPAHKQLFDGKIDDRQLNVKNFYRHFCTFQDTPFNRGAVGVLEDCREYKLPAWYSPLITSAAPTLVEYKVDYEREELEDGAGGAVAIDWATPPLPEGKDVLDVATPVLCVFPGMAGHSEKDYIRSMTQKILQGLGWRVCVMNWRGFNSTLKSARVSCPADTSDMEQVFHHASAKYPGAPIFAIGFSMGSNQLVKYLGKHNGKHPVTAAVSVCNGFEYEVHMSRVESTTLGQSVYSRGMTYLHQEYLRTQGEQLRQMDAQFDLDRALAATSHSEFDQAVFPLYQKYGPVAYADLKAYYADVDSRPFVPSVSIPLLCIQSADDPLFTEGVHTHTHTHTHTHSAFHL